MNTSTLRCVVPLLACVVAGCDSVYYSTMEAFGFAKRDLLVDRVEDARESQTEAKEQFQTTFEAFKALTGFEGGELESRYTTLSKEYTRSKNSADDVTQRIASIEAVAGDMFSEWGEEIEQFSSPEMKRKSEALRADTQRRYDQLIGAMRAAETRMAPVLTAFNDQVLFLKHNLNAQAISSLQDQVVQIESNVGQLIQEMQRSIDEADAFLQSLPS